MTRLTPRHLLWALGLLLLPLLLQQVGNGWVRIAVSDTGPGIPAAMAERIFEPFSTTKATGTGMGLAMSRSIIEAHGGRIWVESEVGQGSTFYVFLPFAPQPATADS